MKENMIIKKILNNTFYIGLFLITLIRLIQDSNVFNIQEQAVFFVKIIAAVCFGIKIITQKYSKKQFIITALLLGIATYTTIVTRVPMVLLTTMIFIAIKDDDIEKTIKIIFYTTIVTLIIHMVFFTYDYFTNFDKIEILNTSNRINRYSFHFRHPNTLAAIIFACVMEWEYLYYNKVSIKFQSIVIVASMIFMYMITKSRTLLIMFLLLWAGIIIIKLKSEKINKIVNIVANSIFPVISIMVFFFLCGYNLFGDTQLDRLDELSSRRTSTGIIAKEMYGMHFFAKNIDEEQLVNWKDKYVTPMIIDSFYMHCLISYGAIFLFIISIYIYIANKNNALIDKIYIILFSVLGITEMICFDIALCITLLLIANEIWNHNVRYKIKVITSIYKGNDKNAGPKAPMDIIKILENEYNAESVCLRMQSPDNKKNFSKKALQIVNFIKRFLCILDNVLDKKIIILQHPFTNKKSILKMLPKNRTVILMHDCEALRYGKQSEMENLKMFKYIIVHNEEMKRYLEESGITANLYILELFDYLCNPNSEKKINKIENKLKVAYAGNLIKIKSPFVYQIKSEDMNFELDLYGIGINSDIGNNIKYIGAESPEELPNKINANCGLVWDGNFDESDEKEGFKNYTKYNNPHKLSCYIAAGIPVIVWRKSAIAKFVEKNNIGYLIDNIYAINSINFSNYNEKLKNVQEISLKVRKGYFTKRIIKKCIDDVRNGDRDNL